MDGGESKYREIVINSKYRFLEGFIKSIPHDWNNIGETIYKKRNEIKVVSVCGMKVNIKAYKIPHLINKIAYVTLRPSKAKRTYYYAHKLQNMSVETPEPIAYVNCFKRGVLRRSFFISLHLFDYPYTVRDVINKEIENKELLLRQFTRFTYFSLLRNGVHHLDYSRGNILIKNDGRMHQFSIVDINRMRFEKMTNKERLGIFSKLWAEKEELEIIGDEYAKITDDNSKEIVNELLAMNQQHKIRINRRLKYKKKLKQLMRGKKIQN